MRSRAFRIHEQKKAKAKTRPIIKRLRDLTDNELDSDPGLVGTWANSHRKRCSCEWCSPSERKYKRNKKGIKECA